MKFPEVTYKYKGDKESIPQGEYWDYGAMKGCFGINPIIVINYSKIRNSIDLFVCILHEMIHFLSRPLPLWLEKVVDISLDVTWGKHEKELVYDLYRIMNEKE